MSNRQIIFSGVSSRILLDLIRKFNVHKDIPILGGVLEIPHDRDSHYFSRHMTIVMWVSAWCSLLDLLDLRKEMNLLTSGYSGIFYHYYSSTCGGPSPPHMAGQKQDEQLEHTYSSYVRIQDVSLKTCQRRWTIGRSGERGSGISLPVARHGDVDSSTRIALAWNNSWRLICH